MSSESAPAPNLPHDPLSIVEARILGCLCEKEVTTPDYYPLTLNALVNACNQKSNRYPVMDLDDDAVSKGLDSLRSKRFAFLVSQAESRVPKFRHTLDAVYPIPDPQKAILAELLLRGPQTPGELRARCERMAPIDSLESLKRELDAMTSGAYPIVTELPRQPGKKDSRFAHLLCGAPDLEAAAASHESGGPMKIEVAMALPPAAEARIAALEALIAEQAAALSALQSEFAAFRSQFE